VLHLGGRRGAGPAMGTMVAAVAVGQIEKSFEVEGILCGARGERV
jgi:hypothetical protein